MKLNDFTQKVGYSEKSLAVLKEEAVSESEYLIWKNKYYVDEDSFLEELQSLGEEKYYRKILYYFTRFAVDLYSDFLAKGFTEEEYFDTFKDLKTWTDMCELETGICGIREVYWLTSHLHLGIVTLGRLQFQYGELETDVDFEGQALKEGLEVLNVHIPFGGPLTVEEVENSFKKAREKFGEKYLHIESWILDPTLEKYLAPTSNLLSFARRFTTYKVTEDSSIERFVFKVKREDKRSYEAKTSFQKKIKDAVINGEKFYSGYGICKL